MHLNIYKKQNLILENSNAIFLNVLQAIWEFILYVCIYCLL